MKKLFSVGFLTSASMLLMTQNAYAGISITTESLWYVIPSAIIFIICAKLTAMMKPDHIEVHEMNSQNSPAAAMTMKRISMLPASVFAVSLVWGVGTAYNWF